ncbi:TonB-dependent receptor [Anopheles sinensis]|uniref:TonB-dependent receptor n=1 Tax=Anopheles sinensis TaxID=74873 RepID=A0A084VB61_ANOSI|nr:TonB-dependent receptor [Anopheles sinensis]
MDPTDAFDNPCDSTGLNVCLSLVTSLWGPNIHVDASEIECKLAAIQVDEEASSV